MKRRRLWLSSVGLCTNVASNVAILVAVVGAGRSHLIQLIWLQAIYAAERRVIQG